MYRETQVGLGDRGGGGGGFTLPHDVVFECVV